MGTVAGCSNRPTADQALDASLASMGASRKAVAPFAGKITVDGQPPKLQRRQKILVLLHNPSGTKPSLAPPVAECNEAGEFAFQTYTKGDGAPPGDYVVTIAQLTDRGKNGYLGPDGFKNLYNDPDRSEFQITHADGGRTDYTFDVHIEGRAPLPPGPRALQRL